MTSDCRVRAPDRVSGSYTPRMQRLGLTGRDKPGTGRDRARPGRDRDPASATRGSTDPNPAPALTVAGWGVGILVTVMVVGTPLLLPAYRNPSAHLVLDTADTCVALLVAYLLYGRFARSKRLQDLLLAEALLLLALAGLGMTLLLGLLSGYPPGTLDVWLPMGLRGGAAVLVLVAAFAGDRVVTGWTRRGQLVPWAVVALATAFLWLLRDRLPVAVSEQQSATVQRPLLTEHPLMFVVWALAATCFLVASVVFTRQVVQNQGARTDHLLMWAGPAFALAGFARINYTLFPSLYTGWLYTGDLLRTASYVLLLVGATREIRQYWSAQARVAVLEDRRRLARELHDGVVQELGYIRIVTHGLSEVPEDARRGLLASCDRALDEARAAVDALGRSPDEPLSQVLHRAARQVAERYGARVEVDLDASITTDAEYRHALVRITREAVSNAIRHGQVGCVRLGLWRDPDGRHRLVVSDDGRGFDPQATRAAATGFGLTSMTDRALALGGSVDITSEPGKGTNVEVRW